jgi:hypothetical protein
MIRGEEIFAIYKCDDPPCILGYFTMKVLLTIPVAQVQKREEYIATCTTAVCVVV